MLFAFLICNWGYIKGFWIDLTCMNTCGVNLSGWVYQWEAACCKGIVFILENLAVPFIESLNLTVGGSSIICDVPLKRLEVLQFFPERSLLLPW